MEIPTWIINIYKKIDANNDNVISADELKNLDRNKCGIGTAYSIFEGQTLDSFVNSNRSIFQGYVKYGDEQFQEGRQIQPEGSKELEKTNNSRQISLDSEKSIEVLQGEYSINKYSKETPYLQTCGLGPCVAVTFYDKASKTGVLAHIDTSNKAKSLHRIISELKQMGIDLSSTEISIIGGQTGSSVETAETIGKILKQNNINNLKEVDLYGNDTRSIQLNLDTGEVTDYDETIHTTSSEDIKKQSITTLTSENLGKKKNSL